MPQSSKTPVESIYLLLINHFGGVSKTAKALSVAQSTVSGWLAGDHGMSGAVAIRAEIIAGGKFKAAELIGEKKWRGTSAEATACAAGENKKITEAI